MKVKKTLRQVVGLVVVGAALAFTGSAAHAQTSGGNQTPGTEGPCPNQNCGDTCPLGADTQQMNTYVTVNPVCVNCDATCPGHFYHVRVTSYAWYITVGPFPDGTSTYTSGPCKKTAPEGGIYPGTC
jgi:hypothetical protein